jgi:hypothetical protein
MKSSQLLSSKREKKKECVWKNLKVITRSTLNINKRKEKRNSGLNKRLQQEHKLCLTGMKSSSTLMQKNVLVSGKIQERM